MVTSISDLIGGDDNIQTISGTVVNVFDDEFILEDETGEVLVDAYDFLENRGNLDLEVGQEVTVVGDLDDEDFDARSITTEDNASEPSPPPRNNDSSQNVTNISDLIPGDDNIQTISGTVVNVFDDEFILEDETGEILVDADDWLENQEEFNLEVGQELTVVGDLDDEDFDARSITLTDDAPVTDSPPSSEPPNTDTSDTVTNINELIQQEDLIQTISGTVVSVFDDEFILEDETGEILVDADDWLENQEEFNLEVGQEVTVVGDLDDEDFDARSITSADDGSVSTNNPDTNSNTEALRLTGGTAQIAYVAYYGRAADIGGLTFWNDVLSESEVSYAPRASDPLTGSEQDVYDRIVNEFGNSEEADRFYGSMSNAERVNQVYQFAFDRDAEAEGLNFWTEQIDNGNVTLATFALEVALGARNDDIVTLNQKIESADLFTNSIDTQEEIDAYRGSSGEVFGRTWLDGFGSTTSSQEQVDLALNNLVNGDF